MLCPGLGPAGSYTQKFRSLIFCKASEHPPPPYAPTRPAASLMRPDTANGWRPWPTGRIATAAAEAITFICNIPNALPKSLWSTLMTLPDNRKAIPINERLIFAMDVASADQARALIRTLGDHVNFYKIGLELFLSGDYFELADELKQLGKRVFADLKLLDR